MKSFDDNNYYVFEGLKIIKFVKQSILDYKNCL